MENLHMEKIIIVLDALEGHVTHVFTSNPALDVRLVDIDIDALDPVIGPYDPKVTVVVSDVDAAARKIIKEMVPCHTFEEEEGSACEEMPEVRSAQEPEKRSSLLDLGNGYALRCGYDETAKTAFLYGSDPEGRMVKYGYWDYEALKKASGSAVLLVLGGLVGAGLSTFSVEAVGQAVQAFLEKPSLTGSRKDQDKKERWEQSLDAILTRPETCAINGFYWVDRIDEHTYRVGDIGEKQGDRYTRAELNLWAEMSRVSLSTGWCEAPYQP
jgi:hypothetical protein